tara:strand:- start:245 stop:361 length:117 start_codon:yes stop_codon:yes gene_type:complete
MVGSYLGILLSVYNQYSGLQIVTTEKQILIREKEAKMA